jgi:Protein of unknown function (DUF3592)
MSDAEFLASGAAVFLAIAALCALSHLSWRKRIAGSVNWPTVQGQVIASEFQTVRATINTNAQTSYTAKFHYRYKVGTSGFESRRIAWGTKSGWASPEAPQAFVAAHPTGSAVTVHYDPADPAMAVLDPTGKIFGFSHVYLARIMAWVTGIGGTVLLAIAAASVR